MKFIDDPRPCEHRLYRLGGDGSWWSSPQDDWEAWKGPVMMFVDGWMVVAHDGDDGRSTDYMSFFLCEALLGCMMLYAKCSLRVFVVDPSSLETRIYTQDFVGRIQESCRYIQTTQISHRYHADITQISHKSRGNPISFWKLLPSDTVRRFGCCASKPPGWAVKSREPQRWWTSSPMPHFQCISM